MLNALGKAIGQLADPRLRRPIWLTLAASLAVVVALVVASWLLLARLSLIGIGWLDAPSTSWPAPACWWSPGCCSQPPSRWWWGSSSTRSPRRSSAATIPSFRRRGPAGRRAGHGGLRFALVALGLNLLALPLYLAGIFLPRLMSLSSMA